MFNSYINPTLIVAILPFAFACIATTLAGFLSQDKWLVWVNDIIAIIFVLLASLTNVYVTGQLATGDVIATIAATATLLLSTSFKPLQRWTAFLQQNILVLQDSGFHLIAHPLVPIANIVPLAPIPTIPPTTDMIPLGPSDMALPPAPTNADQATTQFKKLTTGTL